MRKERDIISELFKLCINVEITWTHEDIFKGIDEGCNFQGVISQVNALNPKQSIILYAADFNEFKEEAELTTLQDLVWSITTGDP